MTNLVPTFLLVLALAAPVLAQSNQRGVWSADMNRSVAPCDDFFEFANGAWRAANPIPASMPRWSRRWEAGESTKEQLQGILEERRRQDEPAEGQRGSADRRLLRRLHGRERKPTRPGVKPLAATARRDRRDADDAPTWQRMIAAFHEIAHPGARSASFGGSDNHNPTDVIAQILRQRTRACRTATTTSRPTPGFVEARAKYAAHVRRSSSSPAGDARRRRRAPPRSSRIEKQLAEASLDNVALRDPKATDHKTRFADLQKLDAGLRLGGVLSAGSASRRTTSTSSEPKFLRGRQPPAHDGASRRLEDLPHMAAPRLGCALAVVEPLSQENFAFKGAFLAARPR